MNPTSDRTLFYNIRSALDKFEESQESELGALEDDLRAAFLVLREAAEQYHQRKLLIDAVAYYGVLVRIAEVLSEKEWSAQMLHGYGVVNLELKDYKESIASLRLALSLAQETGTYELELAVLADLEAARLQWSEYLESIDSM